jgi:hypothetical protein
MVPTGFARKAAFVSSTPNCCRSQMSGGFPGMRVCRPLTPEVAGSSLVPLVRNPWKSACCVADLDTAPAHAPHTRVRGPARNARNRPNNASTRDDFKPFSRQGRSSRRPRWFRARVYKEGDKPSQPRCGPLGNRPAGAQGHEGRHYELQPNFFRSTPREPLRNDKRRCHGFRRQPKATSPTATANTEATNGSRLVAAEYVVFVGRQESRA